MIRKLKQNIWFWIHRHRRNRLVARFCCFCGNIHRAFEHPTYDVAINGERMLLLNVISKPDPLLFDVGANIGDWSSMAKKKFPKARIQCFEMNQETAKILEKNCRKLTDITVHSIGLGDSTHTAEFYSYEGEQSVLSSLRANLYSGFQPTRKHATIITGDEFCEKNQITRIDLLKVDAEGADYEVIKGFSRMLAQQAVSVIQFEHEGGRYIRDFYDLLSPFGYRIGKLYSGYVEFREHDISMERFLGPNYVAIHSSNQALIKDLETGWRQTSDS